VELDKTAAQLEKDLDWTLLLEASHFLFCARSACTLLFLLLLNRFFLGWYADHSAKHLAISTALKFLRAEPLFYRAPEIK